MTFNLNAHLPDSYDQFPDPFQMEHKCSINLSNNEFIHSKIKKILRKFSKQFTINDISCYPSIEKHYNKIATFFKVKPQQMALTAGIDHAIANIMSHLTRKQGSLILQSPAFYNYYNYAKINGLYTVLVNSFQATEKAFTTEFINIMADSKPSIAILNIPNGFTGTILSQANISPIIKNSFQHNHILIIDEAYADYAPYNNLSFIHSYPNILVLRTFSKGFGIAGLRLGVIFGDTPLINFIKKIGILYTVSNFTLSCASYLLQHYSIIKEARHDLKIAKKYFIHKIHEQFPHWKIIEGYGNFITIRLRNAEEAGVVCSFLEQHNILIKNLQSVAGLEGSIRITLAEKAIFKKLIEKLTIYSNNQKINRRHFSKYSNDLF